MMDLRPELVDALKKEHIGPDPGSNQDLVQENGEEILNILPTNRYSTAILYPQELDDELMDELDEDEKDPPVTDNEDIEEVIKQTNKYQQSALAVSIALKEMQPFEVTINGAFYAPKKQTNNENNLYYRMPIKCVETISGEEWTEIHNHNFVRELSHDNQLTGLELRIFKRYELHGVLHLTVSVENKNGIKNEFKGIRGTFFQSEIVVTTSTEFLPIPNQSNRHKNEDDLINDLLFRHQKLYAVGHGVSVIWDDSFDKVKKIVSSFIPTYEIKPILPRAFDDLKLSMKEMADDGTFNSAIKSLELLIQKYNAWSETLKEKIRKLDHTFQQAAQINIKRIETAKYRMQKGLEILQNDSEVAKAFKFMNKAMIRQQLRHGLPISRWKKTNESSAGLEIKYEKLPEINDEKTWYDKENRIYGQWRPFQIAFILLNIESMANKLSDDRNILDLIWFPTGGGKTEAYLGLSALSIFLRRLRDQDDTGTDVIMRYTLRLLTTQQFERAASLIVACDYIRSENSSILGEIPISIGLWVGGGTSPNKNKDAIQAFDRMYSNHNSENPFKLLRCPNCGAEMGPIDFGDMTSIKGYYKHQGRIKFVCENKKFECHYSNRQNPLPIYVVDEDIYEFTPTLVLGTVDKFANIPYKKDSVKLFGHNTKKRLTAPPNLIIQDELHLISGPLGSTVGHYETIIDYFVREELEGQIIKPKYVASTATISRAKKQCNNLYACGEDNVFQFPPQGIEEGDSFFAYKDTKAKGRLYSGLMISGKNSKTIGTIRTYAKLLFAVNELHNQDLDVDPYWTNVAYFNNIRQLGQVVNWVNQDIKEFLNSLYTRDYYTNPKNSRNPKRYLRKHIELTSRINSTTVSENLHRLELSLNEDSSEVIDVALATNMISVGLDVSRLGLMTVNGQPKTTSEYIQATSRVGRDFKNRPGLVIVLYDSSRSRDRSHYENFQYYHSKIYAQVEPTSVTSFSTPVMKRFMHAVVIAIMRLSHHFELNDTKPTPPSEKDKAKMNKIILERVKLIDPELFEDAEQVLYGIFDFWEKGVQTGYTVHEKDRDGVPLMYPPDKLPNKNWIDRSFPTPNSMRSVDQLSQIEIINGDDSSWE